MRSRHLLWAGAAGALAIVTIVGCRWLAEKGRSAAEERMNQARLHFVAGNEYFEKGNYAAAQSEYSHALTWQPGLQVAEENLELARKKGSVDAISSNPDDLIAAIKKNPDNDSLKVVLVEILTSQKRYEEAGAVAVQISDLGLLGQVAASSFRRAQYRYRPETRLCTIGSNILTRIVRSRNRESNNAVEVTAPRGQLVDSDRPYWRWPLNLTADVRLQK
jgi:hypothetical protein